VNAKKRSESDEITREFIQAIEKRLGAGQRVRRGLPGWGRISIDRPLPFLIVHRSASREADPGTDKLFIGESAYISASSKKGVHPGLSELVRMIARTAVEQFGAFFLLEIWAAPVDTEDAAQLAVEQRPSFAIITPRHDDPAELVDSFEDALSHVKLGRLAAKVRVRSAARCTPGRLPELLPLAEAAELGSTVLGLEILPIFRSASGGEIFPLVGRRLRRSLSRALRRTFYEFSRTMTTHRPEHFHVLGRRAVVKAVWEVDRRLATIADEFDFLLQISPANALEAWDGFKSKRFQRDPRLHYRHCPFDPAKLKRKLYEIPIERVDDPALSLLFRQKQQELDRQLTMLLDRNTPRFLLGSMQLYGRIQPQLLKTARSLIDNLPARTRDDSSKVRLDAEAFARRAEQELSYYTAQWRRAEPRFEVRKDMGSGLMVSQGKLLIGSALNVPENRVEALLQHEVGTHVVTYYNGLAQPFHQLRVGLAGYEALQEGLAVLAEYLVGGLTRPRLRLLAARVLAAQSVTDGASFVDCFRQLEGQGFDQRTAFGIAVRVLRGGGLTKDALYLQGLVEVLRHLGSGGRLRPLLVGKIATDHIPIIRELQWREVLVPPPLTPRYLDLPHVAARLERVREGIEVIDLIERKRP